MSTHVVNEFHAKSGRGDDVLAQHYDDYLAWRTENGYTARFDEMLSKPMLIRYFDEIPIAAE
jgi:hypothetical protein